MTNPPLSVIPIPVPNLGAVVVEQGSEATVKENDVTLDQFTLAGTTPDFPSVRDLDLAPGCYFTEKEVDRKEKVAVLGASLVKELFGEMSAVGQVISVGNQKLAVIGVFKEPG